MFFLKKNINLNKKKTESKMENPTHSFREMSILHELTQESQIKVKLSLQKLKENIFCNVFFRRRKFLFNICVISM